MEPRRSGRIATFYSYRGGVGRTLALANVAWILASNGQRVLTIDWDLEAPGLHRFFRPFLEDPAGGATPGLIDFVHDFTTSATMTGGPASAVAGFDDGVDILPYVQSVKWPFPTSGYLDLMPAGRYDATYEARVNSFDWPTFYQKLGGARFLDRLRARLREDYDYVLIDSRTGLSDACGICTVKMPDMLVLCFTMNPQSLAGCSHMARSVIAQRTSERIRILPVPMRLERAEKDLLDRALAAAEQAFDPLMPELASEQRRGYWRDIAFFSNPFYSFGEVLAVFGDRHRQSDSLLASAERLAAHMSDGQAASAAPVSEKDRHAVLARYQQTDPGNSP